jgi:hypothetical protein
LADDIAIPQLPELVRKLLYYQQNPDVPADHDVDISLCPQYHGKIHVFHSATSTFLNDRGQSTRQQIRCKPTWRNGPARLDCVFVDNGTGLTGFKGLYVGQVLLLLSLQASGWIKSIPCALIQWFTAVGDKPCHLTGMWMVEPEYDSNKQRIMSVIHLDCILRPAHLIPIYGAEHVPHDLSASDSLNAFNGYYVNKFSDYHAYNLAF